MSTSRTDRRAEKQLVAWMAAYVETRGSLPRMGVTMFDVPGLGAGSRSVECSVTGKTLASFSSYDAASLAIARSDRALRSRVRELAADTI